MMRSLYSGVTGLRSHQTKMDVIGNNIANVNTAGFKASRVIFQDIYSQTVAPASASTASTGGTNPQQIGLGVQLATIDVLDTKSSSQYTGNTLDIAINGDGYFVIQDGSRVYVYAFRQLLYGLGKLPGGLQRQLCNGDMSLTRHGEIRFTGILSRTPLRETSLSMICASTDANAESGEGRRYILTPITTMCQSVPTVRLLLLITQQAQAPFWGQVVLATFSNPNGLEKTGENAYRTTVNSGDPAYSAPGRGRNGFAQPGFTGDVQRRSDRAVCGYDHDAERLPGELAYHYERPTRCSKSSSTW